MKKRIYSLILLLVMLFLCSCDGEKSVQKENYSEVPTIQVESPELQTDRFSFDFCKYLPIKKTRDGLYSLRVIDSYDQCQALYDETCQNVSAAVLHNIDVALKENENIQAISQFKELYFPQIMERYESFVHAFSVCDNKEYWEDHTVVLIELADGQGESNIQVDYDENTEKLILTIDRGPLDMVFQPDVIYMICVNLKVFEENIVVSII